VFEDNEGIVGFSEQVQNGEEYFAWSENAQNLHTSRQPMETFPGLQPFPLFFVLAFQIGIELEKDTLVRGTHPGKVGGCRVVSRQFSCEERTASTSSSTSQHYTTLSTESWRKCKSQLEESRLARVRLKPWGERLLFYLS